MDAVRANYRPGREAVVIGGGRYTTEGEQPPEELVALREYRHQRGLDLWTGLPHTDPLQQLQWVSTQFGLDEDDDNLLEFHQ